MTIRRLCTALDTNAGHCGACDRVCAGGTHCSRGSCAAPVCTPGQGQTCNADAAMSSLAGQSARPMRSDDGGSRADDTRERVASAPANK